jgi:hypothetical protein
MLNTGREVLTKLKYIMRASVSGFPVANRCEARDKDRRTRDVRCARTRDDENQKSRG